MNKHSDYYAFIAANDPVPTRFDSLAHIDGKTKAIVARMQQHNTRIGKADTHTQDATATSFVHRLELRWERPIVDSDRK